MTDFGCHALFYPPTRPGGRAFARLPPQTTREQAVYSVPKLFFSREAFFEGIRSASSRFPNKQRLPHTSSCYLTAGDTPAVILCI
jgi:hypothetical protein